MVRVLVLTHGRFGHELVAVAEKILGPVSGIDVMSNEERSALQLAEDVRRWLDSGAASDASNRSAGVPAAMILIDDQGGSCATAALCAEADRPTAIVIGGLNLAMLLGLILWRESLEPQELADRLVEKGRQAIIRIEPPV